MNELEILTLLDEVGEELQAQVKQLSKFDRRKTRPENERLNAVVNALEVAVEELDLAAEAFMERRNLQRV